MTIWLLALILTAIACATLYYAGAGRTVNAAASPVDATAEHFRAQLQAIETDSAAGRMGEAEAISAKAELAREVLRLKAEGAAAKPPTEPGRAVLWAPVLLVAVLSLGTYYFLGHPDMPAVPLAGRDLAAEGSLDLNKAITTIETRLAESPDDLRGWQVIAPAYIQLGRYADAVRALRRVNELAPPTAASLTDLGEAVMLQNGGAITGEPLELFRKAVALDPTDIRSRFYVASEETRAGNYQEAIADWNGLLALAKGDEPWVVTARDGLSYVQQQLDPATASATPGAPNAEQIATMVDGLDARLKSQGGSIEEWTRLVRSRMVQGRTEDAQAAYDAARKAYPDPKARTELDVLAADNGLVARETP